MIACRRHFAGEVHRSQRYMYAARDARCRAPTSEWDRWQSRALGDAYRKCIARRVVAFDKDCERFTPITSRLQHRGREQSRRRRMVLEQRQMRHDIFGTGPVRPRQIERTDPKLIRDGTHEHQPPLDDVGHPALEKHIFAVNALMRANTNWGRFYRSMQRALPKQNANLELNLTSKEGEPL